MAPIRPTINSVELFFSLKSLKFKPPQASQSESLNAIWLDGPRFMDVFCSMKEFGERALWKSRSRHMSTQSTTTSQLSLTRNLLSGKNPTEDPKDDPAKCSKTVNLSNFLNSPHFLLISKKQKSSFWSEATWLGKSVAYWSWRFASESWICFR